MRRSAFPLAAAGVALLVTLAGCGHPVSLPSASGVVATTAPTTAPTTPAATRPALCDRPEPASQDPFPFNRDAARRDKMVRLADKPADEKYLGGIESFDDLGPAGLAALLEAKFIDPYDRQNAAPTAWQIFKFLCGHPQARAAGYVVSLDRDDYRTSIESVYAPSIDDRLRADAAEFCVDTDGLTLDGSLECFWD